MTIEEQVMEVREKQAFWQGVVRGVIGSAVFFCRVGNPDLLHRSNRGRAEMSVIKEKPLSCGAERLWIDLLRQRFYGEHFIKFDCGFAARGADDG